jgi:hypothetical protein
LSFLVEINVSGKKIPTRPPRQREKPDQRKSDEKIVYPTFAVPWNFGVIGQTPFTDAAAPFLDFF